MAIVNFIVIHNTPDDVSVDHDCCSISCCQTVTVVVLSAAVKQSRLLFYQLLSNSHGCCSISCCQTGWKVIIWGKIWVRTATKTPYAGQPKNRSENFKRSLVVENTYRLPKYKWRYRDTQVISMYVTHAPIQVRLQQAVATATGYFKALKHMACYVRKCNLFYKINTFDSIFRVLWWAIQEVKDCALQ